MTLHGNTWEREIEGDGAFHRKPTSFHHTIAAKTPFEPAKDRYHLYVSYACPWAHRTLIIRKLKGLEDCISVDVVSPFLDDQGWSFDSTYPGATGDTVNHCERLKEIYLKADTQFSDAVTVPVLWDKQTQTIVNNESSEIIRILNSAFNDCAQHPELDFYPERLRGSIDEINAWVYRDINNGVYRCGFARSQKAYDRAFKSLFKALERVEAILSKQVYLVGDKFTEADIRLFTTLVRFDAVYHTHFKCNLKRIIDFPAIWKYVRMIYHMRGVADTVNMDHIKHHYYQSHTHINPFGVVPGGPEVSFD